MRDNVLITGGSGFIGSAMIRRLLSQKRFNVLNIDKLTYAGNNSSLEGWSQQENYHFLQKDIVDQGCMRDIFTSFQPRYVVHFAAESHVDRSIDGPDLFLRTNVFGTFSLLEAARAYLSKFPQRKEGFRFHHVSTDEVFGSLGEQGFFNENTSYDPRSPYSASKASSDHLVRAWGHTYGLPITLSNCSNNYGPFHFPEKLIPLSILSALHHQPVRVYGNGTNVRDWLHVEDHVEAIQLVLERGRVGETYAVGGSSERSNLQVVQTVCQTLDALLTPDKSFCDLITFVEDRPGHDWRYAIDCSKITKDLAWRGPRNFETGIKETVQWYLDNKAWWAPIWYKKEADLRRGTL